MCKIEQISFCFHSVREFFKKKTPRSEIEKQNYRRSAITENNVQRQTDKQIRMKRTQLLFSLQRHSQKTYSNYYLKHESSNKINNLVGSRWFLFRPDQSMTNNNNVCVINYSPRRGLLFRNHQKISLRTESIRDTITLTGYYGRKAKTRRNDEFEFG